MIKKRKGYSNLFLILITVLISLGMLTLSFYLGGGYIQINDYKYTHKGLLNEKTR